MKKRFKWPLKAFFRAETTNESGKEPIVKTRAGSVVLLAASVLIMTPFLPGGLD